MYKYFLGLKAVLLIPLLSSCALSYTNSAGQQRIIGLVSITLEHPLDSPQVAGEKVSVSNIGLMYSSSKQFNGLSVGYTNESTTVLKNDVILVLENDTSANGN